MQCHEFLIQVRVKQRNIGKSFSKKMSPRKLDDDIFLKLEINKHIISPTLSL